MNPPRIVIASYSVKRCGEGFSIPSNVFARLALAVFLIEHVSESGIWVFVEKEKKLWYDKRKPTR